MFVVGEYWFLVWWWCLLKIYKLKRKEKEQELEYGMQIKLWISWKSADLMLRSKNWKKEILVNKLKQQSGYVKYHAN